MMKFIDTTEEHNQILYELGILDDEEDWPLYKKMIKEEDTLSDHNVWWKYMVIPGSTK